MSTPVSAMMATQTWSLIPETVLRRVLSAVGVLPLCYAELERLTLSTSPVSPSIAAATTDRACTSRPTLVRAVNTGASSHM